MDIRVRAVKLWLLLVVALSTSLQPCCGIQIYGGESRTPLAISEYAQQYVAVTVAALASGEDSQRDSDDGAPDGAVSLDTEQNLWEEWYNRKYFYAHNETQIALARAEAEALHYGGGGGGADTQSSILGSGRSSFPDFPPSEDGCNFHSAERDLAFYGSVVWDTSPSFDAIQILAVDSCATNRNVQFRYNSFEICSQRWVRPEIKPDILIRDDPNPLTHSFKVLVKISASEKREVLADGVYFPATGKMHLVGCDRTVHSAPLIPDLANYSTISSPPAASQNFLLPSGEAPDSEIPVVQGYRYDPDSYRYPPLNSSTSGDCAISATVQYPPLNSRRNMDRVLIYSIRSNRAKDDPRYFEPIERSAFFPYIRRYFEHGNPNHELQLQRRFETGGRILLLVLGLLCLALQIEHGRDNEESLAFVSRVVLGIQLANHFSQTSIFKDLQIGQGYSRDDFRFSDFPDWVREYDDYDTMAWSEHVPYQAMNMVGIAMYLWLFNKVGDRRRIMKLRVLRQRPGAKDPPSDGRVMYATLAIFAFLCSVAFVGLGADQYGQPRLASTGTMDELLSPFVSLQLFEWWLAQWGIVNKLTGLVVSFFLVPQLVGNLLWEVEGRPLSAWFYAGIPFLQSLPHVFLIAKHLQLLPVFPWYDPYMNSLYGVFENPALWLQVGIVVGSAVQVLAVHSQFSRSLGESRLLAV